MSKPAWLGALTLSALLALGAAPAVADWRSPIAGAPPTLPSRFEPVSRSAPGLIDPGEALLQAMPDPEPAPAVILPPLVVANPFAFPLLDRRLSPSAKNAPLDPDLLEAILRIEPIYDPTLVDGPAAEHPLAVSAGTATMDDVFADHWHVASADPNVNRKVRYLAMAWARTGRLACDAYTKTRPHGFGDPALNALSDADCAALSPSQTVGLERPVAIASGRNGVPVFAAPLPGARLSSQDFWAAQRARIAAIQAHLHRKWDPGGTISDARR